MAKKIKWEHGDVFAIPLLNNKFSIGQILDLQMQNVVRISLFDEQISKLAKTNIEELCNLNLLISLVACSRERLDYGVWTILGNKKQIIPVSKFPNELYRLNGWVGAKHSDAAIIEDFVNSYYGFLPWDDWGNPNYLDKFLIDPSKKPTTLIYKKDNL